MKKVAIIPARGGSKRIFKKNIKDFCGKPILAYSILLAQETGVFDCVVVSSDDAEILEVAKNYGANPLQRPQDLSNDTAATLPVMAHAVESLGLGLRDLVCCIYATAPLLEQKYVLQGMEALLQNPSKNYAFGVAEFANSPLRGFFIQEEVIELLFPQYQFVRSQDLQKIYHDAGAFYWGYAQSFLEQRWIFGAHSLPILLPKMMVQDIDTMDDWNLAEIKYKMKHAKTL
ncbi:pseudaminic acid cytidylyltransferase [Helicobacter mustelae]|nr:pseudaminic acid cytidylyltransferase [Helicobacter mustelae]